MLSSRIIFNKVILFSVEAYLSKSIKDGYTDESLNITTEEIRIMKKNEEYEDDSEFGTGNTFLFTFKLQKK